MFRFLSRRSMTSLVTLVLVVFASFFLSHVVPSNPAIIYVGPEARPDEVARVVRQLGLDQSLPVQFWRYLTALLRGDWGTSIATKQPVLHELASRLPATLELLTVAITAAAVVGTALGVVAARRQGRPIDAAVRLFSIAGVSMPTFWLGLLLQIVASRGSLPVTGRNDVNLQFVDPISRITGFNLIDSLTTGNWSALHDTAIHLILPALTLAAYPTGLVARMTRAAMIETLAQDHTGYARIQGLPERVIVWRLALRNALPTTITVLGLSLAFLLTGTFFVEVIFNWPGIGQFATDSLLTSDYPAIQGITLLGAIGYLLINLVVDLVNARLDPRVRLA